MNKIYLRIFAGLGNQQFQYAFAKTLSLKYNKELILDSSYFLERYHPIKAQGYLYPYKLKEYDLKESYTNFLKKEFIGILNRYGKIQKLYQIIQSLPLLNNILPILITHDNFDEKLFKQDKNFIISGFFQKYYFFEEFADEIREKLTYKKELSSENQKYLEEIKADSTVSVHIRRGDYIEKQNVANNFANVTATYFDDAIKYISSKVKIDKLVVFSDDIQWVKDNLRFGYECTYIENDGPDFQHQYLMSQCNHNITSNSSYSWWGAWLNPNKEKIVCAPERWFANEEREKDTYRPNSWVRVKN